jgi:glycosyltransferase involved in cell wall biosynthesis
MLNRMHFLRGKTWDIIHAWDCRPVVILPALFARQQSGATKARLVIDWCDWWGRGGTQAERSGGLAKLLYAPVETYFEEAFRTKADATTVISQALYRRSVSLNVPPDTIRVLPQGCDIDESAPPTREEAMRKVNMPELQHLVVSVGALTRSEAALFFQSVRLLFTKRSDCRVVMIGKHGALIPLDLREHPQFFEAGFVSDEVLRNYVGACSALLVPLTDTIASRGRWPSKVNPFLAAGRAVVITNVGDLAALLKRENAGIVTRCDAQDIVENLIRLFDNPSLQRAYELKARHVAEEYLAWPLITEKLEQLYRTLRPS